MIVRDKSKAICELIGDPQKLKQERDFAKQTRDKLSGVSTSSKSMSSAYSGNYPAGPGSGKYEGFGSEDMHKMGGGSRSTNQDRGGGSSSNYDPYTAKSSHATKE